MCFVEIILKALLSEVFDIKLQIKLFKNCVFFFCLYTKETKNQEQTILPHLQPCIAFVPSSRAFSLGCFLKIMKSSVFRELV